LNRLRYSKTEGYMDKLLKSKPVIEKKIASLSSKCLELKENDITPTMKVILVGKNPASIIYTRNKKKFMEKMGANCEIISLPENLSEKEFLSKVNDICSNHLVHGCFVQLPLPKQLSHIDVGGLIPAEKDVDGLNPINLYRLARGSKGERSLLPCTPMGIITLMQDYGVELEGKNVVIIGRSMIVGRPMGLLLLNHNATVSICHSKTKNLKDHTKSADIIISAIGKANFITRDFLNDKGNQILIDVGMNHDENNKLCGDIDLNDVLDSCAKISPVPGGVGPMTILSLAENLISAASRASRNIKS
jgi:methylenetetrahydrofolate dehydrogenase (NADP+) / methenyltetrahydrofolate cyclohydrolase